MTLLHVAPLNSQKVIAKDEDRSYKQRSAGLPHFSTVELLLHGTLHALTLRGYAAVRCLIIVCTSGRMLRQEFFENHKSSFEVGRTWVSFGAGKHQGTDSYHS
jgi:hypothetical protein